MLSLYALCLCSPELLPKGSCCAEERCFRTHGIDLRVQLPCKEEDIPYYQIESEESREIYNQYRAELKRISNLYLLGKLEEYKYCNKPFRWQNERRI